MSWFWKDDSNNYIPYDPIFAGRVEKVFMSGADSSDVAFSGTEYQIDFINMKQQNKESYKVREIRRDEAQWFYFEDNGKAKAYKPADSKNLEASAVANAATNTAHFTFVMFGTNYDIDLVNMTQKNPDSGKVRKIQRRGGSAPLPKVDGGSSSGAPAAKVTTVETSGGVKKSVAVSVCTFLPMPGEDDGDDGSSSATAGKSTAGAGGAVATLSSIVGAGGKSSGITTAIMKGGGVVDVHSGLQHTHHIYTNPSNNDVYQCMLNQTNIAQNNNKYYVIQLLAADKNTTAATAYASGQYYVFTRWGRVGSPGQQALDAYSDPFSAMKAFEKKFREKTQNSWDDRANFTKIPGKYHLMDIDLGATVNGNGSSAVTGAGAPLNLPAAASVPIQPSKLSNELQKVMRLISNKTEMTAVMKELKIDTDKMPLGKISKKQIKDAFDYLKQIEKEIANGHSSGSVINNASSMFYTLIPHNFGFSVPPLIKDSDMLKEKMKLLEVMGDLEIAAKLLSEGNPNSGVNPLDSAYESLKVQLTALDHSDADFLRVVDYVKNTHGPTHNNYKLVVEEVFKVVRPGEEDRYKAYASLPNKQMLWHGSRTTNYMGILSQGLRIAPPEAPSTGYMYGKGVYLADSSSKSANYCHTSPSSKVGFTLLCEAALGTTSDWKVAKYMDKPQPGTNSTRGLGRSAPDPAGAVTVGGVKWPVGKMKPCPEGTGSVLLYPEYIVYDVAQCVIRYMVQLRFDYY